VHLLTVAHPDEPALDMAVSHALLRRVAAGAHEPAARVYRPGATMAFGRLDALREGFPAALRAAAGHGYTPVLRLGGGHAAGYDAGAVVVELVVPETAVARGLQARFASGTRLLQEALAALGVRTEAGELPGEYCPGQWSLHLPGGPKVAGASQRVVRGASLFTAVVVAAGGGRLRAALSDVYAGLAIAWDPATAGSIDQHVPGVGAAAVRAALIAALAARQDLDPAEPDAATLAAARDLAAGHRMAAPAAA